MPLGCFISILTNTVDSVNRKLGTPGDRRNVFVLSGVTCMHLYRLGELTLYSLADISLIRVPINESLL